MTRPSREEWHLRGALWLAEMGDCTRRKVGALIIGSDKRIVGAGYNGGYPGGPSCLEGACPRGRHARSEEPYERVCGQTWHLGEDSVCSDCLWHFKCLCGEEWPCADAVAPGSAYDTGPGACIASHAEANAIADASLRGSGAMDGAVMYVSCEPCEGCVRHIRNTTRIQLVRWPEGVVALP